MGRVPGGSLGTRGIKACTWLNLTVSFIYLTGAAQPAELRAGCVCVFLFFFFPIQVMLFGPEGRAGFVKVLSMKLHAMDGAGSGGVKLK